MGQIRINKQLNLVIPIELDAGITYIYSSPLRREVFEKYFLVISKTFTAIYNEGLHVLGGPRVAYLMLKSIASDLQQWEGDFGVENGIINEIKRTSSVLLPSEKSGFSTIILDDAIKNDLLNEDEISEILGYIVFFICISALQKKQEVAPVLETMGNFWGTQTTLLNVLEFKSSLQKSNEAAISEPSLNQSLVPS